MMAEEGARGEPYANNRNGAVGAGRGGSPTDRSKENRCKYLNFKAYSLIGAISGVNTREDEWRILSKLGFDTLNWAATDADGVVAVMDEYDKSIRDALDYDIDGLVVAIDSIESANKLGMGSDNRPKHSVAWKFAAEVGIGVINSVTWEVGRGGMITPVANFSPPVSIGGTNVIRASLHNAKWVEEKGIGDGAEVVVKRAGDVIPQVDKVLNPGPSVSTRPTFCPECGQIVDWGTTKSGDKSKHLRCYNKSCPAIVRGGVLRWLDVTRVKHFGAALVDATIEAGLVVDAADLFKLKVESVENLTKSSGVRFGTKYSKTALRNLRAAKEVDLPVFIDGLGIQDVGESVVQSLVDEGHVTYDSLLVLTDADLTGVPGIGGTLSSKIRDGLVVTAPLAKKLFSVGVKIAPPKTGKLVGMNICFTGSRDLVSIAEREGARVTGMNKKVSVLVADDIDSGSTKAKKARGYGIDIVSRDQFMDMVK